jgi:hypothetical protein
VVTVSQKRMEMPMKVLIVSLGLALAAVACGGSDGCPTEPAFVFTGDFHIETEESLVPLWASYEAGAATCADGNQIGQVTWDEDDSTWGAVIQNSSGEWMVHVNVDDFDSETIKLGWLECRYVVLEGDDLNEDASTCSATTE